LGGASRRGPHDSQPDDADNTSPMGSAVMNAASSRRSAPSSRVRGRSLRRQCVTSVATTSTPNGTCVLAGPNDHVADPQLGPLADNAARRHAPAGGVEPGDRRGAAAGCPATDQRGQTRPTDGNGDASAVCTWG
jgi:hypothetical protein